MKRLFQAAFFLFFTASITAQDAAWPVEIFCVTENLPASPIMTFTMTAQSPRWDVISNAPYPPQESYFFLTEDYEVETYIPTANNLGQNSAGFEFVGLANAGFPVIGFGLYKVTNNLNNKYFYLDYRDYRSIYMVWYQPNDSTWQNSIDIWMKYDGQTNMFTYSAKGHSDGFDVIENGQLLNIWDIKQKGTPLTNLFPDYWENALGGIKQKNPSTGVFEPFIVWGPYNDFQPLGYQIYWYSGGNFNLLETVSASTHSFRHQFIEAVDEGSQSYYKVRAYNNIGPDYSDFTNVVSITVGGYYMGQQKQGSTDNITENLYLLAQNYPNPFNPVTTMSFSITENAYVTLKVYDILGKVVVELVNRSMEAGNHSISFDAANLPSGLYFYSLSANGYSETKKMILAK